MKKVKTRRVLLDDVIKNHLKDREDNTRIFQESKTEKIEVDIFYGDASIKVTIYRRFSQENVWTDSESSVDEEETYTINYKEIWDKIKMSEDLMTQLFSESYDALASVWDLEEDLDAFCTRVATRCK